MPAYFNLSLQFLRKELSSSFMTSFDTVLAQAGLRFFSGYWEDKGLSQREIAVWNQRKLNANFVLGMTTHRSQDYKQTLYQFRDYKEVRGFWLNQHPDADTLTYFLIIPESEVLTLEGSGCFRTGRVAELLELAQKLWQFPLVRAIQTGLELSDGPAGLNALRAGEPPSVQPFAILEPNCPSYDSGSRVEALAEGRPGVLLAEDDTLPIWKKP